MRWLFLFLLTVNALALEENLDMTGDGRPERIVLHDLGGTYPVVEVEIHEGNRTLAAVTLYDARVADVDGDGRFEILATDPRVGPHKEFPTYVLRCDSTGLHPAPELMSKLPLPSEREMQNLVQLVKEQPYHDYPLAPLTEVRKMANRLVYSGHGKDLPALLRRLWPEVRCQEFLEKYREELHGSELWPVLSALNPELLPRVRNPENAATKRAPIPQSSAPRNKGANHRPRD